MSMRWSRLAVVVAAVALGAAVLSACGATDTPATGPSPESPLLEPDAGWVAAGGAGFRPVPFKHPALLHPGSSALVGTTGSEARVKWVADRADPASPQDALSTLTIHIVDITDPAARADITLRGAGGAGSADLPIEAGKRTVYRLSWSAVGTYRRCSALIEVRTP